MLPNYPRQRLWFKTIIFLLRNILKRLVCLENVLITVKVIPELAMYEKLGGKNDYKDEIVYVYDYEKGDK